MAEHYLNKRRKSLPILVLAESEGGDVAAQFCAVLGKITHLILLATGGGMSQADEFRFFITKNGEYLGMKSLDELEKKFQDIQQNPDELQIWAGHPYRRWKSYLFKDSLESLAKLSIPIFMVHGTADESVPIESARKVKERFSELKKLNLTYLEIENANHSFFDAKTGKYYLPEIGQKLMEWLNKHNVITDQEYQKILAKLLDKSSSFTIIAKKKKSGSPAKKNY